ncbi:K+-sensing histidine kinase KdpD [Paenibacillus sp. LBL]|nr:K+-sensing histidine kinase KdpD [Paenibacillus sp. LBL]
MKQHGGELEASNHPQGGAVLAGWLPVAGSNPKVKEANSEISDN